MTSVEEIRRQMAVAREQLKARKRAEHESDARVQRFRTLTDEQKGRQTIEGLTKQHMEWNERNGIKESEEAVRAKVAEAAINVEKRKEG